LKATEVAKGEVMSEEKHDQFEVGELDEDTLESVAGGVLPEADIVCSDKDCPNNGCASGCNPNVIAGCT
jgi:hypothetical protein